MSSESIAVRSCMPLDGSSSFYVVEICRPRSTEGFRAKARAVEALETRHFASLGELCQFFRSPIVVAEAERAGSEEDEPGSPLASGSSR